jgi:hypothetical protein
MVSVSDDGTGMSDEVKSHLFEAFFTTKGFGKGTGMGLAMIQGIVAQSSGRIGVTSEVGRGTMFRVYLPRSEGTAVAAGSEHVAAAEMTAGGPGIIRGHDTMMPHENGLNLGCTTTAFGG